MFFIPNHWEHMKKGQSRSNFSPYLTCASGIWVSEFHLSQISVDVYTERRSRLDGAMPSLDGTDVWKNVRNRLEVGCYQQFIAKSMSERCIPSRSTSWPLKRSIASRSTSVDRLHLRMSRPINGRNMLKDCGVARWMEWPLPMFPNLWQTAKSTRCHSPIFQLLQMGTNPVYLHQSQGEG